MPNPPPVRSPTRSDANDSRSSGVNPGARVLAMSSPQVHLGARDVEVAAKHNRFTPRLELAQIRRHRRIPRVHARVQSFEPVPRVGHVRAHDERAIELEGDDPSLALEPVDDERIGPRRRRSRSTEHRHAAVPEPGRRAVPHPVRILFQHPRVHLGHHLSLQFRLLEHDDVCGFFLGDPIENIGILLQQRAHAVHVPRQHAKRGRVRV